MHKEIDKLERNFSDRIKVDGFEKKGFDHEAAFKISGGFSSEICSFCWDENPPKAATYLGQEFKYSYQSSDCCFLMSWMADDPGSPCDWQKALQYMHPEFVGEKIHNLKFSAVSMLITLNYFTEHMSACYNYDFSPVIFFIRSMFFESDTNILGWDIYNEMLSSCKSDPNSSFFEQYYYEKALSPCALMFDKNTIVTHEKFLSLSKKLIDYGIEPSIGYV